eukprot:Amastigsp_a174980_79.p3 type:complete len:206 gc:universal Amastigsp_a174980_79:426-1043(+)
MTFGRCKAKIRRPCASAAMRRRMRLAAACSRISRATSKSKKGWCGMWPRCSLRSSAPRTRSMPRGLRCSRSRSCTARTTWRSGSSSEPRIAWFISRTCLECPTPRWRVCSLASRSRCSMSTVCSRNAHTPPISTTAPLSSSFALCGQSPLSSWGSPTTLTTRRPLKSFAGLLRPARFRAPLRWLTMEFGTKCPCADGGAGAQTKT